MYSRSEEVMHREIAMLRSGPQDELADAIGHLAVLHIAMGEMRQTEKDDFEALRIRESMGDPVGVALTWTGLADVDIKQRHYKQALDYAQRAMAVLAENPKVDVADRIVVRQTLAYALCGLKECGQAIPILKDAIEMEKSSYGADSLMVGTGYYLLGYTYWQNGDMEDAAELMARGTARMKVDLGWGHTIYLNAMTQDARFLRQRGQKEAAATAEREIKIANAVVDARSLTTSSSAFAAAGSR
jgi:tetratricopeptide (TPR) repeat protein